MTRNNTVTKQLIGCSYKNDEFDWSFDLVIVTWKNNPKQPKQFFVRKTGNTAMTRDNTVTKQLTGRTFL